MPRYKSPYEYYVTLGLRPGASAKEVRRAFLALVKQWHPDRFPQNSRAQLVAQEKLKAINEAYTFLRDYNPSSSEPNYGNTPSQAESYPRGPTAQWREYQRRQNYRPPVADPYAGNYQYRPVGESRGSRFAWIWAAIVIVNFVSNFGSGFTDSTPHAQPAVTQAAPVQVDISEPTPQEPAYFFPGSSKADVYRIHGMPDWSNEVEWRYGDSRVFFHEGVVSRWQSGTNFPLKAMDPSQADSAGKYIRVGSTMEDVLAIQGKPTFVGDNLWKYGESTIRFTRGRVISWEERPGSTLNVWSRTLRQQ